MLQKRNGKVKRKENMIENENKTEKSWFKVIEKD